MFEYHYVNEILKDDLSNEGYQAVPNVVSGGAAPYISKAELIF